MEEEGYVILLKIVKLTSNIALLLYDRQLRKKQNICMYCNEYLFKNRPKGRIRDGRDSLILK